VWSVTETIVSINLFLKNIVDGYFCLFCLIVTTYPGSMYLTSTHKGCDILQRFKLVTFVVNKCDRLLYINV